MSIFFVTAQQEEMKLALEGYFTECEFIIKSQNSSLLEVKIIKAPYGIITINLQRWIDFLAKLLNQRIISSYADVFIIEPIVL